MDREVLPPLRKPTDIIAVLCSDLHLSHQPPVARSAEENWYVTQAGYLGQLAALAAGHGERTSLYNGGPVPVICAGDLFDDGWRPHRCPAELINFALAYLPRMYAIPGQHDLPHHRYEDIRKSAYWTLVEAGKIIDLKPREPVSVGPMRLWGFPWRIPVEPCAGPHDMALEVAVIHSYVWTKSTGYVGAPPEKRVLGYDLRGYNTAVFGDNHIPFDYEFQKGVMRGTIVCNCGGYMRRKSDERIHRPSVGLLHMDGKITRHFLDVSEDKFLDETDLLRAGSDNSIEAQALLDELSALGDASISFVEAVRRLMERKNPSPLAKRIVLASLERTK